MPNPANASAGALLRLKADANASAQRERINLVNTTFFTRNSLRVNPITGEYLELPHIPPVSIGFIEYPDGGAELFGVRRIDRKSNNSDDFESLPDENDSVSCEKREKQTLTPADKASWSRLSACRRAKTKVRRICRYYGLHVMVTLTFPSEGIQDYDTALYCVQKFINDHGECLHLGGVYVAVPELHPSGHGWHWHVLIERTLTKEELNNLRWQWTLFLERKGIYLSSGAKFARINVKAFANAQNGAAYASKYIGKSFESDTREINRKRYLASKRAMVPIKHGNAFSLDEVRSFLFKIEGTFVYDSSNSDDWSGPDTLWACW